MSKVLFISRDFSEKKGGANVVAKRNLYLLTQLFSEIDRFEVPLPSLFNRIKNLLLWKTYGETTKLKQKLRRMLLEGNYDIVFIDGSYYGKLVKICHDTGKKTICFFHNVEYKYYREKYKLSKKYIDLIMSYFIRHSEAMSVRYSTAIASISSRDQDELKKIYGRSGDYVLPTSFLPIDRQLLSKTGEEIKEQYLIFVGTKFFANVEAATFIINKLASHIIYDIWIVGDVCEMVTHLSIPDNIKLIGTVDSLDKYYRNAIGVIAPVFSGSGLKTKTIEALRYGKSIIGTHEAFEGIPLHENPYIGKECNTPEEFIKNINSFPFKHLNDNSLEVFLKLFSHNSQLNNLKKIIEQTLSQ